MSFLSIDDFSMNLDLVSNLELKKISAQYPVFDGSTLTIRATLKNGNTQIVFLKNENYDDLYKQLNETCFKFSDKYFTKSSILFFKKTSKKLAGNDTACIELTSVDGGFHQEYYLDK